MNKEIKTSLGLLAVVFFWGTSWSMTKIGLKELSAINLFLLRFSIASILFLIILKTFYQGYIIEKEDKRKLLFLGILGISLYFYIQIVGVKYTTTINSSIIMATSPIATMILSSKVFHQEELTSNKILGAIMAFLGILLIFSGGKVLNLGRETLKGNLLIFSNSIAWAFFTVLGKPLVEKYSPFVTMAYITIYGTLVMIPLAFVSGFVPAVKEAQLSTWLAAFYLASTCSVFGFFMWYRGIKILGPTRTAMFNYLNPLTAVIIGIMFLKEPGSWHTFLGGFAILMGVYMASKADMKTKMFKVWENQD